MLKWEILPNSFWKQGSDIYHYHLPQLSMLKAHGDKNHTALEQLSVGGGGGWGGLVWEGFVALFFFFFLITCNWLKPEKPSQERALANNPGQQR